jgi:hypothetical protein
VPVLSPDSYPHSRAVEGRDPNRDFDSDSPCAPVAAVKAAHQQHGFAACLSAHTYGRQVLRPLGHTTALAPDDAVLRPLFDEMARLARYRSIRACELYGRPIQGSEVDWYYARGACSCVLELGTHQRVPTKAEIDAEAERTWPALLLFLERAPVTRRPVGRREALVSRL